MSFDFRERSLAGGSPIEFLTFDRAGATWRYTSAELDTDFRGDTYVALAGVARSAIEQSGEDVSNQITLTLPRTAALAAEFVGSQSPEPISVTLFVNHRGEDDSAAIARWVGEVAQASFQGSTITLLCTTEKAAFGSQLGRLVYSRLCPYMLYDEMCGADRAAHTFGATVTVLATDGRTVTVTDPVDLGATPSVYEGGYLTLGVQKSFILKEAAAGVFTLQTPLALLEVGSLVTVTHGCKRTTTACRTVFNNLDRFGGFPLIPLRPVWIRLV